VQLTDISERHTVALHRVSWWSVWFVEVEEIIIDLRLKPIVTLQEVRLPWLRVLFAWQWYLVVLFLHSSLYIPRSYTAGSNRMMAAL
jgi:hypothetical protein